MGQLQLSIEPNSNEQPLTRRCSVSPTSPRWKKMEDQSLSLASEVSTHGTIHKKSSLQETGFGVVTCCSCEINKLRKITQVPGGISRATYGMLNCELSYQKWCYQPLLQETQAAGQQQMRPPSCAGSRQSNSSNLYDLWFKFESSTSKMDIQDCGFSSVINSRVLPRSIPELHCALVLRKDGWSPINLLVSMVQEFLKKD